MISNLDLWRAAQVMVKRYGDGAATEAAIHSAKQPLSQWSKTWLESAKHNVSEKTHERYAQLLGHVVALIRDKPLALLQPLHIERAYNKLYERFAARTVLHIHRVLSQCLGDAKRLKKLFPTIPRRTRSGAGSRLPRASRRTCTLSS